MKIIKIFAICISIAPATFLSAQSTLKVNIDKLENNKGVVIVALLDENQENVMDRTSKISNNRCTVTFNNVKKGQYAIQYFHDENQNKKLDTNIIGIPKEGFGFSNDAMGKFGPKDFSKWLFNVSGDTNINMSTKYMF